MSSLLNCRRKMLCRLAACFAVLPVLAAGAAVSAADSYNSAYGSPRQYYGHWQKHPTANYYYRGYYYKPTPSYAGYKHHYVILYPSRPSHHYFYNPYKKQYWGRCEVYHGGKGEYSHLAPEYRKSSISEIPENAFPTPGKLPNIPDSSDGSKLDLPPDDLPEGVAPPAQAAPTAPPSGG